ncbi:MAG: hypothetical protein JNJ57_08000 [Saprospiraceae bacterium]|nr:hypothetical protein [Saprospiraceae bacterium]
MKKLLICLVAFCCFSTTTSAQWIRTIGIQPFEMAYSNVTGRLYVALEQTVQFDSIEIAIVNPTSASVEQTIRFPGRPASMAISNDGNYLFLGGFLPNKIRRINLVMGLVDLEFSLQNEAYPALIVPSPNDYKKVVFVEISPAGERVAFYDEAVRRPNSVPYYGHVVFRNTSKLLSTYNSADNSVLLYNIDANGITQAGAGTVDNYPPNTRLRMIAGRLAMSNGRIYSFNGDYPQYYSFYFNQPFQSGSTFTADTDSSTVYFIHNWHIPGNKITLHSHQNAGNSKSIIGIGGLTEAAKLLTNTGGHGRLAFAQIVSGGSKLVLLSPCLSNVPAPVIDPSAPSGCDTDTITLSGPSGFGGYFWSNGSNEQTIFAQFQNTYTLQVLGPDGCLSPRSAPIQILTDARPPMCSFLNNSVERFCEGDSVVLTAIPPSGWEPIIGSYLWSTGETTQSITVSQAGNYTVSAVTNLNCVGLENFTFIEVFPLPQQPQITLDSITGNLIAPFAPHHEWYLDGELLEGENLYYLNPTESGTYTVVLVSVEGCKSPPSDPFDLIVFIHTGEPEKPAEVVSFQCFDLLGRLITEGATADFEHRRAQLQPGAYVVLWFDEKARPVESRRLIMSR